MARERSSARVDAESESASAAARRAAAATMDADDDARALDDANEGPRGSPSRRRARRTRRRDMAHPAWTFLPLEVTRARARRRVARSRPGDRPALDVKVTLARRREDAGATRFGTASRFTSQKRRTERKDTNVGPGTYDAANAADALAPNAPAADFGRASRRTSIPRQERCSVTATTRARHHRVLRSRGSRTREWWRRACHLR